MKKIKSFCLILKDSKIPDTFQTAQNLRSQMQSLRIGGEIPPNAMGMLFLLIIYLKSPDLKNNYIFTKIVEISKISFC